MVVLAHNSFFSKLIALDLPTQDFAIFGSGPMFAHGLKDLGHDIDIVARGRAWEVAAKLNTPVPTKSGNALVVELFEGEIEIFNSWAPGEWNIDELIDNAEVVEGVRFVQLEEVLKWKRMMNRPKDVEDIALIDKYLKNKSGK